MFKNFQIQFLNVIQKFWFPLFFAAITCVQFFYIIFNNTKWDSDITRIAFYSSLGISLGFGIEFLDLKNKKSQNLAKFFVCIFIFLEIIWSLSFDTRKFLFTFANVFLLSHLFVALSFWFSTKTQKAPDEEKLSLFWKKNWDLFIGFQGSFLINCVLFIGLVIAIMSINTLFKAQLHDKLPLYILAFLTTVGGTFYLGTYLLSSENEEHYESKIILTLVNFIFPILQITYFSILYLYLGKILIEQNLPRGYVGWLVSCLSVLVCLSHLIIKPNIAKGLVKPFSEFVWRYSFIAMIPLLALLSIAITRRISDYGLTESRYLLFCLHLWMYAMAFSHFRPKVAKIQIIPLSLFILTLITSLGPLSPSSMAFWSQKGRLASVIKENQGTTENNKLLIPSDTPIEGQKKILKTLHHICKVYGVRQIYKMLEIQPASTWPDYEDLYCYYKKGNNDTSKKPFGELVKSLNLSLIESGGFSYDEYDNGRDLTIESASNFSFDFKENIGKIPDLNAEFENIYLSSYSVKVGKENLSFGLLGNDQVKWIPRNGEPIIIDIRPIMEKLTLVKEKAEKELDPKEVILRFENKDTKLYFQINTISFNKEIDGTFKIKALQALAVGVKINK